MTNNKKEHSMGTVTVSKKAALQAAEYIAKNTDGVAEMTDKSKRGDLTRILLGKGGPKGVYLIKEADGLNVEIYVICRYGANAANVCKSISASIRSELGDNMGIPIKKVTVRVEGVDTSVR